MQRVQRFYDCITDIGDRYVQDALEFQPSKVLTISWKRWGSIAAAFVLILGIGMLMPRMGSSKSEAPSTPAASAPAASAPAAAPSAPEASAPAAGDSADSTTQSTSGVAGGGGFVYTADICYQGETYRIIQPEEAGAFGVPEEIGDGLVGDFVTWLELVDGVYCATQEETGISLHVYAPELYIISDGENYLAAQWTGE